MGNVATVIGHGRLPVLPRAKGWSSRSRRRPWFVDRTNDAIARRVDRLEAKDRLDLDAVATAIDGIRDPELVAARLGATVRYTQRVEAEVAGLSIETLLPYARDDYDGRFLDVWVPDELGHAEAQELLLDRLGLPRHEARLGDAVPPHNRVAGLLGRLSPHAYEIVSLTYHAIGAINERLAQAAYERMAVILDELGEHDLARALLRPMRRDESQHLGYYRTYARQLRAHLPAWQVAVTRALIVHTYAPVGAGTRRDRPVFGEVLVALEDDPENPAVADAVHGIARELLARPDEQLPPFALAAMRACLTELEGRRGTVTP